MLSHRRGYPHEHRHGPPPRGKRQPNGARDALDVLLTDTRSHASAVNAHTRANTKLGVAPLFTSAVLFANLSRLPAVGARQPPSVLDSARIARL